MSASDTSRRVPILTYDACGCCGGTLPMLDGDNDIPDAPSVTGGECPGHTSDGWCGCYDAAEIEEWIQEQLANGAAREEAGR